MTFKERGKVECGRPYVTHSRLHTTRQSFRYSERQRQRHFKGSVPGDFFPRSASTSDVKAAASDMLRPTQTKHASNFQATQSFFFS